LGRLGIVPLPPEFAAYFKAGRLDTDKLAKAVGIDKQ
jgi:hypothetical protein